MDVGDIFDLDSGNVTQRREVVLAQLESWYMVPIARCLPITISAQSQLRLPSRTLHGFSFL